MSGDNSSDNSGQYSGDNEDRDDCQDDWVQRLYDYNCEYFWDTSAEERNVYYKFHIGSSILATVSLTLNFLVIIIFCTFTKQKRNIIANVVLFLQSVSDLMIAIYLTSKSKILSGRPHQESTKKS